MTKLDKKYCYFKPNRSIKKKILFAKRLYIIKQNYFKPNLKKKKL